MAGGLVVVTRDNIQQLIDDWQQGRMGAAGLPVSRASMDNLIGQWATNLDAELLLGHQIDTFITGPAGGFSGIQSTTGIFGATAYTDVPGGSGDATHVFGGGADGEQIYQIYIGAQTLGSLKNFQTGNINKLFGFGTH